MDGGAWVPIDPAKDYLVATNNYVRQGGDGYKIFATNAKNAYDYGPGLEQVVADYLAVNKPYTPKVEGRITEIAAAAPAAEAAAPADEAKGRGRGRCEEGCGRSGGEEGSRRSGSEKAADEAAAKQAADEAAAKKAAEEAAAKQAADEAAPRLPSRMSSLPATISGSLPKSIMATERNGS